MAFPHSPPTRHSMRMHPLCSWRQLFSLLFPLTGAGMRARRHSVDQPHVAVRLARLSAGQPRQRKNFTARRCFNPRKWHFRTRHPSATPRGCALPAARRGSPLSLPLSPRGHGRAAAFSRSAPRRGAPRRAALRPPAARRAAHAPAASSCSASLAEVMGSHPSFMATKPHLAQLRRTL